MRPRYPTPRCREKKLKIEPAASTKLEKIRIVSTILAFDGKFGLMYLDGANWQFVC